jgi:hypothetical protein
MGMGMEMEMEMEMEINNKIIIKSNIQIIK